MPDRLLPDAALESSSVVANSAMNRDRQLAGANSYVKELGFHPLEWLLTRSVDRPVTEIGWLDLCCGSGRSLIQAAALRTGIDLVGVDLVDHFAPVPDGVVPPKLICAPIGSWTPDRRFDLITCVHGLHYLGDKLGTLARVAGWPAPDGRFVADFDPASIRLADGTPAGRPLVAALRAAGFTVDLRRRRISRVGPGPVALPYRYLGADDRAGPNYTGQPAVHSYYERLS